MPIDPKDLRLMKLTELRVGGVFYRKDDDGYHRCQITAEELKSETRKEIIKRLTKLYCEGNRLYVRTSKPFSGFE